MHNKSVKLNIFLNAFRMSLTVLVPLITFPYTSRVFLTEGSGQLSFASSVVQVFILFASLGIYTYGVREGSKVKEDKLLFSKFAQELLLVNGIASIFTYVIFLICVFFVSSFQEYRILLLINGVSIGFTALGLDWVYGVYEEYGYITIRQIAVQIFTIITMFIFVHDISDIYIWASLLVLSSVGANIFNCIHARKFIDYKYHKDWSYKIGPHWKPIIALFATQLAAKIYLNIDTILLGIMSTEHHVGLYSAAVKLNTILITCFTAMMPVFVPRIVEAIKNGRKEDYISLLRKILMLIISFALPAVVGIEIFAEELIILLAGQAFIEATVTIRILAPIILITSVANVLYYNVLVPNGKENSVLICTITGGVINIFLSIFLINYFQENGAAIGSLISELFALILAAFYCFRFDTSIFKNVPKLWNYLLGSLIITAWCEFIKFLITDSFLSLFLGVSGSVILYLGLLMITKDDMGIELIAIINKIRGRLLKGEK